MTESKANRRRQTTSVKTQTTSTRNLVTMAMFTAILCVAAYISIPTPFPGSPHITMQNFIILLIALLFPVRQSVMIVGVWLLIGMIGLPVYVAGMSGIGYLLSAWGGYTVSFLVIAFLLPMIKGKKYTRIRYTIVAIAGVIIIDIIGMIWLKYFGIEGYDSWKAVFLSGFVAFLPMDLVKAVAVAQMVPVFRRIMPD